MSGKAYRWLPAPSAIIVDSKGVASVEMFGYLDEVARRMGGQTGIENNRVLFSNQGVYTGAIVGPGLTLDRTTNTLSATGAGFPEAPLTGLQYGRQMAEWTVISLPTITQVAPGLPAASIQYNSTPAGTFTGSAELTVDSINFIVRIGAAQSWTLQPVAVTTGNSQGRGLTFSSGDGFGIGAGGLTRITSGQPGTVAGLPTGDIHIDTAASTVQQTGLIRMFTGIPGGNTPSGRIQIFTGDIPGHSTASGSIAVFTGAAPSTGGFSAGSGLVELLTGDGYGSGLIRLVTGISTGGQSGGIELTTGPGSGLSGSITLTPGAATTQGHVNLALGATATLQISGSSGTAGQVLTSNGAALPPSWSPSSGQSSVQFQDEGSNLGASGTVTAVDFVGAGVVATRASNTVTVTISGGGGGGSPGGSNTQVQFNDAGAFGGDADFTWDKTNNILTFGGAASRIKGDFSNATTNSRLSFQTSTANGATIVGIVPDGSSTTTGYQLYSTAAGLSAGNFGEVQLALTSTFAYLDSTRVGSGTSVPLQFRCGDTPTVAATMFTDGAINFGTTTTAPGIAFRVETAARFNDDIRLNTTGVTWASGFEAVQAGQGSGFVGNGSSASTYVVNNMYWTGTQWTYIANSFAMGYTMFSDGSLYVQSAPSGTAGNAVTLTTRLKVQENGSVIVNSAALATNATDGFLYIPTCAGTPTGVPSTQTGTAPIVIDTTNNKLYFYSSGAWRDAGP